MTTFTIGAAAGVSTLPRYQISAEVCRVQTVVSSATASATDVWVFESLKIPHGATVTDVVLRGKTVDGTSLFQLGVNGNAALFGSATISATTAVKQATLGIPYKVSVSDDAATRFQTFQLTVDGAGTSVTTSISIAVILRYVIGE